MRIRYRLAMTVTALGLAVAVTACGGTKAQIGAGSAVKGSPVQGGTVTVAEARARRPTTSSRCCRRPTPTATTST